MDPNPVVQETVRRRRRLLLLLLALDLGLIVTLASLRLDPHHPRPGFLGFEVSTQLLSPVTAGAVVAIIILQLVLGLRALQQAFARAAAVSIYPEDESVGVLANGLTSRELVELVHEMARRAGIRSIARIYLVPQAVPGAFTAHLPGVGNVVALHSNLLDFLPRDGLRAVIAHEVAHMRRSDSLVRQVINVPGAFAFTIFSVVLLQILGGVLNPRSPGELLLRLLFLILALAAASFLLGVLARVATLAAREAEHLADAQAGRLCGWEPVVNMLLLLGERTEALATLARAFAELVHGEGGEEHQPSPAELARLLHRFPAGELRQEVARQVVPELLVRDRLELLRERYGMPMEDATIAQLSRQAAHSMRERRSNLGDAEGQSVTCWRTYDHDRSGDLDMQELDELVQALEASPDRMLFRQFLDPESREQDHPPVRDRILYLYRVLRSEQPTSQTGGPAD